MSATSFRVIAQCSPLVSTISGMLIVYCIHCCYSVHITDTAALVELIEAKTARAIALQTSMESQVGRVRAAMPRGALLIVTAQVSVCKSCYSHTINSGCVICVLITVYLGVLVTR
jgi:hypothetical protein